MTKMNLPIWRIGDQNMNSINLKFNNYIEVKMGKLSIFKDLIRMLIERKKWWLAPILFFLLLLGSLIVLTEGSAIAPFIYTLF